MSVALISIRCSSRFRYEREERLCVIRSLVIDWGVRHGLIWPGLVRSNLRTWILAFCASCLCSGIAFLTGYWLNPDYISDPNHPKKRPVSTVIIVKNRYFTENVVTFTEVIRRNS